MTQYIIERLRKELERQKGAVRPAKHTIQVEDSWVERLIEKAERAQDLEVQISKSRDFSWELLMEIMRYREVLENIRFIQEHRRTKVDYEVLGIVNRALEGQEKC